MRAFWLTLLAAGLILVTLETYDAAQSGDTSTPACLGDDGSGTPVPAPSPTPVAK